MENKKAWYNIEGIRKYTALIFGLVVYMIISKYTPLDKAVVMLPYIQKLLWAFMGTDVIVHLIKGAFNKSNSG